MRRIEATTVCEDEKQKSRQKSEVPRHDLLCNIEADPEEDQAQEENGEVRYPDAGTKGVEEAR